MEVPFRAVHSPPGIEEKDEFLLVLDRLGK